MKSIRQKENLRAIQLEKLKLLTEEGESETFAVESFSVTKNAQLKPCDPALLSCVHKLKR